MSNEQERPDVRHLWQGQMVDDTSMSLDELRRRVSMMHRLILTRALVAGLAFLIFAAFFGETLTWKASTLATTTDIAILRYGFLICAGCGFWWLVLLLRRARGKSLTQEEPNACAVFYRSELERQRNFYRRSAVWVPLAFSAAWVWGFLAMQPLRVIMMVIWVLFVASWVYQSMATARRSQRELNELSASLK
jgi:hypothetical protein